MAEAVYIAGGPGPRGVGHVVVYRGDEMVHDPNPEGGGLLCIEDLYLLVPSRLGDSRPGDLPKDWRPPGAKRTPAGPPGERKAKQ